MADLAVYDVAAYERKRLSLDPKEEGKAGGGETKAKGMGIGEDASKECNFS